MIPLESLLFPLQASNAGITPTAHPNEGNIESEEVEAL